MSTFSAIKTRQGMVGSQSAIHTTIYTRERSLSKPMANKTQTTTLLTADVEFEPYCEWQKDDASDTLVVHLPDFKKDQLRVQVNNLGVLKVSGARSIDGGCMSRFLKETKIPQVCDISNIRARFINGRLHILMPKKVAAPSQVQQDRPQEQLPSPHSASLPAPKIEAAPKPEAEALVTNDQILKFPGAKHGKMETIAGYDQANNHLFGIRRSMGKLQVGKKMSVSFGMAMLAVVAIGIYAAYKCGTEPSCPSSIQH